MTQLLYIYWNVSPDFITIGSFSVKWYGVCWGLALMSCFFIGNYVFKKLNKDPEKLTLAIQYAFVFALIGARLAHILFYAFGYYKLHREEVFQVWKGGLASHGGVVGWILGLYIFTIRNKDFSFFWVIDIGTILVSFLASFIRLGNLMNSELYGKATTVPWAFIFEQVDNIPRHPVVLYESIAYFFLQFFMLYLFNRHKETKPGLYIGTFLTVLFSIRFLLEFTKEPDGFVWLGIISKTQLLNVPFILVGVLILYLSSAGKLHYSKAAHA